MNEVSANLHMSGECLCGAMADQGEDRSERAQLRFFYPEFEARITELEALCREAGKSRCEWGVKSARPAEPDEVSSPMCSSCEFRAVAGN